MREYFKEQLETAKPVVDASVMKGRSLYSEYEDGDIVLAFIERQNESFFNSEEVMSIQMIVERELDKLERDFKFIEQNLSFPVFRRKENG